MGNWRSASATRATLESVRESIMPLSSRFRSRLLDAAMLDGGGAELGLVARIAQRRLLIAPPVLPSLPCPPPLVRVHLNNLSAPTAPSINYAERPATTNVCRPARESAKLFSRPLVARLAVVV